MTLAPDPASPASPEPAIAPEDRRTSEILVALLKAHPERRIRVRELLAALKERGFGFAMLLFALPAALPIAGLNSIMGVPLMLFAVQMIFQRRMPWLPRFVADRQITRDDLLSLVERGVPLLRRIERICKPRLLFLIGPTGERLLGLLIFILAFVITLPGPFTNGPPGIAVIVLSIAMIERDGLAALIGAIVAVGALALAFAGLAAFGYIIWAGVQSLF